MLFIKRLLFELSPYKISLFYILGDLKPESSFHYCFDEIAIIAFSYEDFEIIGVFRYIQLSVDFVCEVYHKDKFFEFIDFDIYTVIS